MAQALVLTDTGDLDLSGGGPRLGVGAEAARGALVYRFNTFAGTSRDDPGEWAYDFSYGVLWRSAVLGRYFTEDETAALLADVATRTTGVGPTAAYQVSQTFDSNLRKSFIVLSELRVGDSLLQEPVTIAVQQGTSL